MKSNHSLRTAGTAFKYAAILVLFAFLLFPVYWMAVTSLKNNVESYRIIPSLWPEKISLDGYRTLFQDGKFRDNPSSPHTALHSAFFPLYFGIADDAAQLKRLVAERGMACSVYAAHFLLETCFARGLVDEAFALLLSDGPRSWTNMLRRGATITMEAWDDCFKPNEDWNHAWGAAPANLIPRWIAGIRPLTPGFRRFAFDPHPGPLTAFSCRVPTPEATVSVEYDGHSFRLAVPEGTLAVTPRGELAPGVHSLAWPVASAAQPRR